jgi:hypothetical protein
MAQNIQVFGAAGLAYDLKRAPKPGYILNTNGRYVSVDSIGAAYTMADMTVDSILLSQEALELNKIAQGYSAPDLLLGTTRATYMRGLSVVASNLLTLTALCKKYNLPTTLQSNKMAQNGYSLDRIVFPIDGKDQTMTFVKPDDWILFASHLNQEIVRMSSKEAAANQPIVIPANANGATMRGLPLAAILTPALMGAGGAASTAAGVGVAAFAWPITLFCVCAIVVGGAVYCVTYGVQEGGELVREIKATQQEETRKDNEQHRELLDRLSKANTPGERAAIKDALGEANERANDAADRDQGLIEMLLGKGWKNILYAALGIVGAVAAYKIFAATRGATKAISSE